MLSIEWSNQSPIGEHTPDDLALIPSIESQNESTQPQMKERNLLASLAKISSIENNPLNNFNKTNSNNQQNIDLQQSIERVSIQQNYIRAGAQGSRARNE